MWGRSLSNYYETNWAMRYHHGYSIEDLEDMIPFELEIYIRHTRNHIKKIEEQQQRQMGGPVSSSAMMKAKLAQLDNQK